MLLINKTDRKIIYLAVVVAAAVVVIVAAVLIAVGEIVVAEKLFT